MGRRQTALPPEKSIFVFCGFGCYSHLFGKSHHIWDTVIRE